MSGKNTKGYWFACVDGKVIVDPALSPFDKAVFAVLCSHADSDDRECYLKVATIAHEAGCSERSVQNSLKKLEELGIIERKARFENNKQLSSLYRIIGDKAPCYATQGEAPSTRGAGDARGGCTTCTQNENHLNYIKDSLTGEAPLPNFADMPLVFEAGEAVTPEEAPKPHSPEEVCTPDDAPDIMKPTAELFLHKTGRQGLTWEEISALRELAATQFPSRVQKEINTACARFLKRGQSLSTLTFGYIAGSLKHQPTRGVKSRSATKPKPAEIPQRTEADAEADMAKIEALQAEFDREVQGR
ncbi:MAG: helix-turn-helix domain-containing protein [Synergistaceae bacterium]|nr:helix-turn-helix domain-containing protein [Synergistaceae bacterium]